VHNGRDGTMRPHVLIVDDEKAFADILTELMVEEGYAVTQAYDGVTALGMLSSRHICPDVLVCDVMLPGLRGDRLAREVRERQPQRRLPILLLSAGADPRVDLRDVWFMPKPIDFGELVETVARLAAPETCTLSTAAE
jgi:CheY-like chemotaxis protein